MIASLKEQGAQISVWGVGTRLVTGGDEPALGGVYKLSAVRAPGGVWRERIKLSEQAIKVSTPGFLNVRRFHRADAARTLLADAIFDEQRGFSSQQIVDPLDPLRFRSIEPGVPFEDSAPAGAPRRQAGLRAAFAGRQPRAHAGRAESSACHTKAAAPSAQLSGGPRARAARAQERAGDRLRDARDQLRRSAS